MSLSGVVLWTCWTAYSFNYKSSEPTLGKKICKIVAYIILSITILEFKVHALSDLGMYAIIILTSFILLKIAHVKHGTQKLQKKEDSSVYMSIISPKKDSIEEDKASHDEKQVNLEKSNYKGTNITMDSTSDDYQAPNVGIKDNGDNKEVATSIIDDKSIKKHDENDRAHSPYKSIGFIYCKYCGKRIETDSLYCKYCGRKL